MSKLTPSLSPCLARAAVAACGVLTAAFTASAAPLTPGEATVLPGTSGGFDFIRLDANAHRLLLGHEGNKSFDVFDIDGKKLLKVVPTSTSQDAVVDVAGGNYYVSGNDPGRMVIVNATTLEITGEVPVPSDTDLIAFNPKTGMVHESNDKAGEQWVIDPVAKKIVTTIKFDGSGVEDLAFDPEYKHLYQAIKGVNSIAVIAPADNQVKAMWPCAPDKGVHGIAIVPEANGLLVACGGKLVLIDRTTGQVTATAPTAARVDEIAYDPGLHVAYCAGRQGKISAIAVESGKLTPLGDTPDPTGTGDIVVDPQTHLVWIAYAQDKACYVQSFAPAK